MVQDWQGGYATGRCVNILYNFKIYSRVKKGKKTTYNRTNKNSNTISQQKQRINAGIDGRGQNAAYTSGAKTAQQFKNSKGYNISEAEGMRRAWENGENVSTYTKTRSGKMSVDGKKAGGDTWTYTNRDMKGNLVSQSGRNKLSTRRQRDYDTRKGMNNISPRVIQAWLDNGMARMVDGNMVGSNGNIIRQLPNGNFSMGLTTG